MRLCGFYFLVWCPSSTGFKFYVLFTSALAKNKHSAFLSVVASAAFTLYFCFWWVLDLILKSSVFLLESLISWLSLFLKFVFSSPQLRLPPLGLFLLHLRSQWMISQASGTSYLSLSSTVHAFCISSSFFAVACAASTFRGFSSISFTWSVAELHQPLLDTIFD